MGGDGCASGPGVCIVIQCRHNLIGDLRPSGTYVVAGVAIPVKRDNAHTLGAHESDALADAVADAMVERVALLERVVGSTCAHDARGPLRLDQIGAIFGMTGERVRQLEASALRKLRRAADDPRSGPWPATLRDLATECGIASVPTQSGLVTIRKGPRRQVGIENKAPRK